MTSKLLSSLRATRTRPIVSLFFFFSLLFLLAADELKIDQIRQRSYSGKGFSIGLSKSIGYGISDQELAKFVSISPETPFTLSNYGDELSISCPKLQPATYYAITIKAGFPQKDFMLQLPHDVVLPIITRDEEPDLDMASRGTFFPMHAPIWELPVSSINVDDEVEVTVSVPYGNRIVDLLTGASEYNCLHTLFTSKLPLQSRRNQRSGAALDLEKAGVPRGKPGIYSIELSYKGTFDSGYGQSYVSRQSATATAVITDMALFVTAADTSLLCQVRRLSAPGTPLQGIRLELTSGKRQSLARGTTDADGCCTLVIPEMPDKGDYPALLMARNPQDGDLAYITLYDLDFTCHGMKPHDLLATIFAERGIVRPGEEIQLCASLREASNGSAVPELPLEFVLTSMSGVEIGRKSTATDGCGLATALFTIPREAALGSYHVALQAPGAEAADKAVVYCGATFLVGDFTPDQLEGDLELEHQEDNISYEGHVGYYFGQPLDNAALALTLSAAWDRFQPPEPFKEYSFDCPAQGVPFPMKSLTAKSDGNGDFAGSHAIKGFASGLHSVTGKPLPACPVKVTLQAAPRNVPGVRPITIRAQKTIHHCDCYIGVKPLNDCDSDERSFGVLALTPEGKRSEGSLQVSQELYRIDWRYSLQESSDGTCRREWKRVETKVTSDTIQLNAGEAVITLTPPQYGQYALVLADAENGRLLCRHEFWHWGGESARRSPNPTILDFSLDREEYKPGDTAQVTFASDFDGQALVVCGNSADNMTAFCQPVHSGLNTLKISIPANAVRGRWFADVTAVGTCGTDEDGRPTDAPHQHGVAILRVKQESHSLQVAIGAPELCAPGTRAHVTVTIKDSQGKPASGEVLLWGVDEGILSLTAYKTPQLHDLFFGDLECPFTAKDIYPAIYPLLRVVNGKIGGGYGCMDECSGASSREASLKTFRRERLGELPPTGVIRLGIISVGEGGEAGLDVELPKESGALRLMAVAATKEATGSAEHRVTIRSAATMECLAPQSVAPGDTFLLQGALFNHDVADGVFTWECTIDGASHIDVAAACDRQLLLKPGERASIAIPVAIPAEAADGSIAIRLCATDSAGNTYEARPCILQIRPAACSLPMVTSATLAPGESRRFDFQPGDHGSLEVGSPLLQLRQHWQWLNAYPYGCLEQSTAAAFPQLAVPALIQLGMLPDAYKAAAAHKVEATLSLLATMRHGDYYAMWPKGESSWIEGSLFAFLFQLEASRCGFDVPAAERRRILFVLRKYLNDRSNPPQERALATYALSLAAPELTAEYVKMLPLDEPSPRLDYMRFLAAMALLRGGFAAEGNALRQKANLSYGYRSMNGNGPLDTPVRSIGLCLWLLADLLPNDPELPRLAAELQRLDEADGNWFTTHEHAWAALGLSQYLLASNIDGSAAAITSTTRYAAKIKRLSARDDAPAMESTWESEGLGPVEPARLDDIDGTVIVENCGDAPLVVHSTRRVLQPRTTAVSNGLSVTREYFSSAGLPVSECQVGDLLEVRITLSGNGTDSIVICDLLPGGFEIEDPQLATRAVIPEKWNNKKTPFTVKRAERLYDRLLTFGNFSGCAEPSEIIRYHIRAVSPGSYTVPQVQAEAMYNPRDTALSAAPEKPFVIHLKQ